MDVIPQNLQNVLDLLQILPDDLVRKICAYANHRIDRYGNFIRLIDFEKYKFLEEIINRKLVSVSEVRTYEEYSGRPLRTNILEIKYTLSNCCHLPDREEQSIDDDMMYVYLNKDTGSYTIKQYRLIKIEKFLTKDKPSSMYFRGNFHRGNYLNYVWEVFTLSSDGSNQYV
jgi:hypothetical protein